MRYLYADYYFYFKQCNLVIAFLIELLDPLFDPLNSNIIIEILICRLYTLSIDVAGRICQSIILIVSCVIMSLILITNWFYKALISQGEF